MAFAWKLNRFAMNKTASRIVYVNEFDLELGFCDFESEFQDQDANALHCDSVLAEMKLPANRIR